MKNSVLIVFALLFSAHSSDAASYISNSVEKSNSPTDQKQAEVFQSNSRDCYESCRQAGLPDFQCFDLCGRGLGGARAEKENAKKKVAGAFDDLLNADAMKYCDERISPLLPDMMASREAYAYHNKTYWGCVSTYKQFISHLKSKGFSNPKSELTKLERMEGNARMKEITALYKFDKASAIKLSGLIDYQPPQTTQKADLKSGHSNTAQ